MAEATLQPAFMGEWTFNATTTPPPGTGQLRQNLNKATLIWVSNITYYGIDATSWLMEMMPGYVIRFADKNDPLKWQSYAVTGNPVANAGYVELKVNWLAAGQNPTAQIMLSVVTSVVRPTGNAMTTHVGSPVASIATRIPVASPGVMHAQTNDADISGQLVTFDYAYPFQGKNYTSPGMTIRQYYVGQAITGFLGSGGPIGNLIGKGAELCFKVADSMIAYEALTTGPPRTTTAPVPAPPTGIAAPPGQANITVPEEEALAMQTMEKKRLKIIS